MIAVINDCGSRRIAMNTDRPRGDSNRSNIMRHCCEGGAVHLIRRDCSGHWRIYPSVPHLGKLEVDYND